MGSRRALVSYHEHNERRRARELAERVAAGETVALVSDAGTPGVSDPGFVLVRECLARGLPVEVLPGPVGGRDGAGRLGAAGRALALHRLPAAQGGRAARASSSAATRRWSRSSRRAGWRARCAVLAELDPERPVAVCRELTKLHEEVVRGTGARGGGAVRGRRAGRDRAGGRARPAERRADVAPALEAVEALVEAGARRRAAAKVVARLTGVPANRLYRA